MPMSHNESDRPRRGRPKKAAAPPNLDDLDAEETGWLEEPAEVLEVGHEHDDEPAVAEVSAPASQMLKKIKSRLAAARGVDVSRIEVQVERGVVVLSGSLSSDAMRRRVVDAVSASGGVTVICNRIRVGR
jgi:hypothetical protein